MSIRVHELDLLSLSLSFPYFPLWFCSFSSLHYPFLAETPSHYIVLDDMELII